MSWASNTVNMRVDVQCKTPENERSLRKLMNVSDMQVTGDAQFPFRQLTAKS